MTNDNIVIEHLRHIRRKVDVMYDDLIDVRNRVSNLEMGQAGLELGQANQQRSIDILSDRISRIEVSNMIDWQVSEFISAAAINEAITTNSVAQLRFSPEFEANAMDMYGRQWWNNVFLQKTSGYINTQNFNKLIDKTIKKYVERIVVIDELVEPHVNQDPSNNKGFEGFLTSGTLQNIDIDKAQELGNDDNVPGFLTSGPRLNEDTGTSNESSNNKGFEGLSTSITLQNVDTGKAHVIIKMAPYLSGKDNIILYKPEYIMDEEMCYLVMMEADARKPEVRDTKVFFAAKLKKIRADEQLEFYVDNKRYTSSIPDIEARDAMYLKHLFADATLDAVTSVKHVTNNPVPMIKANINEGTYLKPDSDIKKNWFLSEDANIDEHECPVVSCAKLYCKITIYDNIKRDKITNEDELVAAIKAETKLARISVKRVTGQYPEDFEPEINLLEARRLINEQQHKRKMLELSLV